MITERTGTIYQVQCDYCANRAHGEVSIRDAKNTAYQAGFGDLTKNGTWTCLECANKAGLPHLKPGEQRKVEEGNNNVQ